MNQMNKELEPGHSASIGSFLWGVGYELDELETAAAYHGLVCDLSSAIRGFVAIDKSYMNFCEESFEEY